MPEVDKIQEAEQIISTVAAELKAMSDAAALLKEASANTKAVIDSAQKIIREVDKFVEASRVIIKRLEAADIAGRLKAIDENIKGSGKKLEGELKKTSADMAAGIAGVESAQKELGDTIDSSTNKILESVKALKAELSDGNKENEVRLAKLQQIVVVFGSTISVGLLIGLIKLFV